MYRLTIAILVISILVLSGSPLIFASPVSNALHDCTEHNHGVSDAIQMSYATCPICGNPGRAIGRESFAGEYYIKYQCRYGHVWTERM